MIRDVLMPQLAMGMSAGTIVEWVVGEGEQVAREGPLLSIETEKVVTDLPSPYAGWLHRLAEAGDSIPVENVIGKIADSEAEYRALLSGAPREASTANPATLGPGDAAAAVALPTAPESAVACSERIRVSGLAKKVAAEHGLSLSSVTGSGPGGRIVRRDVESAVAATSVALGGVAKGEVSAMRVRAKIPLTGVRKAIADRMLRSKTTAAHTYVFFEVDVTRLMAARATMLAREQELQTRISMISLYAKALSIAVRHVPICNSTLQDQEIVVWDNVNIGIAVALPGKTEYESGLVVPVVRNVEQKGIFDIDRDIKSLVDRAKALSKLVADDMSGGTVTLSSSAGFMPGQWCISTPLLNQPQVLNFQPSSPIDKPVIVDGQVAVRTMLPCSLSFDHRALDGEPVARFNRKMSDLLANPELMLL
ncbi:MAG: dihydrolipoamide acetyltransferase family protein [Steroidobacteraceae bacterium]